MRINDILEGLAQGRDLPEAEAEAVFDLLMAGDMTPAQAGALLMGLRVKGEKPHELTAAVRAALKAAVIVDGAGDGGRTIDTCGTGGDSRGSFNCSTAVALYLAGMGYKVVKHGNRAVSSSCGSADVVEMLGLPLETGPADARAELARRNFVFLFAPRYHPAFAKVAPIRRELGMRTLFNMIGPLLNPARPNRQLLGVAREDMVPLMAEALSRTGCERAAVVHGAGGYDELTPFGKAKAAFVTPAGVSETEIDPEALGVGRFAPDQVAVRDKAEALDAIKAVLAGQGPEAMKAMAALNLGAAIHLLEDDVSLAEGVDRAKAALNEGVSDKLSALGMTGHV